jgi:ketosteroid isomerase-like protein
MRHLLWLGAALLAAAASRRMAELPAQARQNRETAELRAVVDSLAVLFERWVANGQADSIAGLYTEDAVLMPSGEPEISGRNAIRAAWTRWFALGKWSIDIRVANVTANGPLGVERGRYTMTITPAPGSPPGMPAVADTGKYLVHLQKFGNRWLAVEDISNSDRPSIPVPPGAERR